MYRYPGKINVVSNYLVSKDYSITNVTDNQFCFSGQLYIGLTHANGIFPISIFNGKREGDTVELYYGHNGVKSVYVVTCQQLGSDYQYLGRFEEALYKVSYHIYHTSIKDNLIKYNTHVHYAKSLNLPIKLNFKSYELILLLDYINLGCNDINHVLKLLYYDLFIKDPPRLSVIND